MMDQQVAVDARLRQKVTDYQHETEALVDRHIAEEDAKIEAALQQKQQTMKDIAQVYKDGLDALKAIRRPRM